MALTLSGFVCLATKTHTHGKKRQILHECAWHHILGNSQFTKGHGQEKLLFISLEKDVKSHVEIDTSFSLRT